MQYTILSSAYQDVDGITRVTQLKKLTLLIKSKADLRTFICLGGLITSLGKKRKAQQMNPKLGH